MVVQSKWVLEQHHIGTFTISIVIVLVFQSASVVPGALPMNMASECDANHLLLAALCY